MNTEIPFTILNEQDLNQLFQPKQFKFDRTKLKYLALFVVVYLIIFYGFNLPALYKNFMTGREAKFKIPEQTAFAQQEVNISENGEVSVSESQESSSNTLETDVMGNNEIYIPSVNLRAPINWDGEISEDKLQENLKTGVAHIEGTSRPGEQGNVFITGHSSYFPWASGDYKSIFATLPKVKLDDNIYIIRGGTLFSYRVKEVFEVTPDKVEVMAQTDSNILTLSTCVPIGTATRRLIVVAEQYSPDPNQNIPFNGDALLDGSEIPATR